MMRIRNSLLLFGLVAYSCALAQQDFKTEQLNYPRVRVATQEKWEMVKSILNEADIQPGDLEIYIRAFKAEKLLELWGRSRGVKRFRLLTTYRICDISGVAGPKRRQGDGQIPEGFYYIDRFNPASNFYLSLGINYPNSSDRILGNGDHPGGDIFIHGDCVTIGCLPITNDKIKELYLFALEARSAGQLKIPVTIYPVRMTTSNLNILYRDNMDNDDPIKLWEEMHIVYDFFENYRHLPNIGFLPDGRHEIQ